MNIGTYQMGNDEAYKAVRWALEVSLFHESTVLRTFDNRVRQVTDILCVYSSLACTI